MALDESCKTKLGGLVAVKPVYGWGWTRIDAPEIPVPNEINGVPFPFHCRIRDFLYLKAELRGAVGEIEEVGHIYHGLWIVFYTRVSGLCNFTDKLPYCNLEIGTTTPRLNGEWHEFTSGSPIVNGYAFVGESIQHMDDSNLKLSHEI